MVDYPRLESARLGVKAGSTYIGIMCGGHCKGCGGCPEFAAWHKGQVQAIAVELRWPAGEAVLGVVQAVPVKMWTVPDEVQYGIEYHGHVYTLNRDPASGRHFIEI